ncbi:type II toxin-antitoxin system RelE/ParE family toxin [Synechococcus sp. PCC 7336]|uniref:type II toxin-antitoxin system RelE/ParE family toxin n=1 Tax=Synechococcus sp. PCC 7336 TaxID=195250 RepID=UPI00034CF403|nr:type II toxin-antitoxin system RelE/ParE family toxin [Synechococcus sp. PCC 7336]
MPNSGRPKQILFYADEAGNETFTEWLESLRDVMGRKRILTRLRQLEQGNYGDCKRLQDGVYELRLFFGPGYRVYFGEDGDTIVVLLCGGDKSTQAKDIETAKAYWQEYKRHE